MLDAIQSWLITFEDTQMRGFRSLWIYQKRWNLIRRNANGIILLVAIVYGNQDYFLK